MSASTVTPPPPTLQLTCPDNQSVQSTTGQPIPVSFALATAAGGTPPTQVQCTPATGSIFNPGTTPVQCTATDSKSMTMACSFNVIVTLPPKIAATRFDAFGDSMTNGEVRSETVLPTAFGLRRIRPVVVDRSKAYPTLLLAELQARYTGQAGAFFVYNDGVSAETTAGGLARPFSASITNYPYQVVLLMEGVNDFPDYVTALGNIRTMVRTAKGLGVRVYLATEPPENPQPVGCNDGLSQNWAYVSPYNDGLRDIAATEGVALVDVNAAFNGDVTTLIDCDGLHPTPAGYQVIAETFFEAIKNTLEVIGTPTPTASALRKIAPPVRKSR
jgi:lysophospholipase L1-like esterase